jgi:HCOMODA/2-hydroxy-3-carboxy-muconic semialdehyde decarboxylase
MLAATIEHHKPSLGRTMEMGRSLAAILADNTCLLMRGHGAVVVGASIREAVLSPIYLEVSAVCITKA